MSAIRNRSLFALALVTCLAAVAASPAEAKIFGNRAVTTSPPAEIAAPPCCDRDICYKHHKARCGCFDPCQVKELVMRVKDPCECCFVDVPVCVPTCCLAEHPDVCFRKGFLGRDVVAYTWPCGFELEVVFKRNGDLIVHYYGI